ncbi:MAG: hypothetical protein QF535_05055, partial [Anaerolineales bacterium]|nr:hypothetical protein [Anaerolineales bacterium]
MPVLQTGLAKSAAADYTIDQSLRFDDGDSAKLTRTPGTPTSARIGTLSWWMKQGKIEECSWGMSNYSDESNRVSISTSSHALNMFGKVGGTASKPNLTTSQLFRDPSAWYHIVYSIDVTQATASDRIKLYVNGEQVTSFSGESYPDQNVDFPLFSKTNMLIGARYAGSITQHTDGYMAEFHYVDGTALDASSFGETDAATNQWKPIEVTGLTYGTNGFYQKYSSTGTNSFTDSSSSAHTITANGDVTNSRAQKKIGSSSIKFDGTGDYLSLADSSDWNIFGSGNWTTETWVKLDNHSQAEHLFGQYASGTSKWEIAHNGAGTNNGLSFGLKIGSGAGSWVIDSGYASGGSGEITDTDWHHVALVKNSTTYTLYLDGTALDNTV